jgi:alpha-tubulin suppressor-like RCC1 family protein
MRIKHLAWLAAFFSLILANLGWGYAFITNNGTNVTWPAGTITMVIKADNAALLSDGTTRAGSIQAAMQAWNAQIATVQFSPQIQAAASGTDHNGINEIFFSGTAYGQAWDSNTLAVTTIWYNTTTSQRTEGDIIFNTAFTWDSYRGALWADGTIDIRRVALHELGHVLGLDHPDLASPPQAVNAIMNSVIGDVDSLQADDIAGAQVLYGPPNSAPIFNSQPVSQTVYAGQSVFFTVGASGTPAPSYKWQRQPSGSGAWSNLSDSGVYSGTGTGTLTIAAATNAMNGDQFRCVATNVAGSTTSNAALLTVNAVVAPVIVQQPVGLTVMQGTAANFSVVATGTNPLSYQWYFNGQSISGATGSMLLVSNVQPSNAGNYAVVVTNLGGSITSNAAALSVTPLPGVIFASAGQYHSLFIKCDGTLWGMGYDYNGELGDGTNSTINTPIQISSDVVSASAGSLYSLFIKSDRTLWGTGYNATGALGDGTYITRSIPVKIADNVVSASAGGRHTLFIKSDGTLWAVGANNRGQLGDGTTITRNTPVQIATNVLFATAGSTHSLFIKSDGTLWAAGDNLAGQLGDGTNIERDGPVKIAANVVSVVAGSSHTLFVKSDGTLWVTGDNSNGQLGDGTLVGHNSPEQVATGVESLAAGDVHSLFIKSDATLWGMGSNEFGELGDGTTLGRLAPEQIGTGTASATGGGEFSLLIDSNGTLTGTGDNGAAQLGIGRTGGYFPTAQVITSGMLTPPKTPTYTTVDFAASGQGTLLAWRPAIGATSYEVWRGSSNNPNTATRIASAVPISLFYDLSPHSGTNYYWVRAVNPAGTSAFSSVGSIARPSGADFNGDGQTDIVWENTATGEHGIWLMNGSAVVNWAGLPTVPTDWHAVATGDFNGDGQTDIVWENTATGEHGIWVMNGSTVVNWAGLPTVSTDWHVVGTGDFNGDGQTDLVWENLVTGEHGIWVMIGGTVVNWAGLPTIPTEWHVVGIGDFNGDGQTDIVWENIATGEHGIWLMNGSGVVNWAGLPTEPVEWQIAGTGDFNGDGQTDIVWENTATGEHGIWVMNGSMVVNWAVLPTEPVEWHIAP